MCVRCRCPQEFVASTVNLSLLEREEVCMKAFAKLDKVRRGGGAAPTRTALPVPCPPPWAHAR